MKPLIPNPPSYAPDYKSRDRRPRLGSFTSLDEMVSAVEVELLATHGTPPTLDEMTDWGWFDEDVE